MRNDQPQHRGGVPLEVGQFTPILGYSSSTTLDQTVASNNKFLYRSIIGASSVAALLLAKKWWEQRDRTRMHRVALKELTGESPETEHYGKQQMPGSAVGMGALSSSSSSESRTSPVAVKCRQRAPSKSEETGKKPQSDVRSLSKDPSATERGLEAVENLTTKLKSYLPSMPMSPRKHQTSDEKGIETAKADEAAADDVTETPKSEEPSSEATDEATNVQPEQSMSAAERKKAKKKQNRAKRQPQITPSTSSHVIVPESSLEAADSLASSSTTTSKASSETKDKPDTIFSRKTQLPDSDRTDSESATPTATAHPTPKAKSKSKMESVVHHQGSESPTRSRASSAVSSLVEERRESNESAPSLSHTLSPRSDMQRLGSVSSLHPLTPAPAHTGLNLLDADFESLRNQEHALEWEQVGSSGRPKKKKKKKRNENAGGSSMSPPGSSASPLSTASNLPSMDVVSNQTTDATSASWMLDQQPCPDCERRKQDDRGRSESASGDAAALAALRKQLNGTEKDEKAQRDLVRSLTLTNASLSERLNHMRDARDALQATVQANKTRTTELEQTIAKQREDLSRASSRSSSEGKRAPKEKASEDWKKKYDTLAKEFNEHKFRHARASEEVQNKVTRQEAQIQEMSRMLESIQLIPTQLAPGMVPNPNNPYHMVMPPNPSPVTPGFMPVAMPMPYSPSGYSVNVPGQIVYPSYENAPRRPPHPQPPRHHQQQSFQRQPSSGPPMVAGQGYQQLSSMWNLASPTASTSRPPSSPSRSSDVSSSILKARNTSADRSSSRGSGEERSAGEAGLGLQHSVTPPENAAGAAQPERQADQLCSPPSGADRKHALIRETKPSETRSALPGRVQASTSEPTPLPEKLEIKITQSTPVVGVSDSPSPGTIHAETEAATGDVQSTAAAEEDYEEPIYASIRLPARDVPSVTSGQAIEASPAKEGPQASTSAETAYDDFAEPVYASIRGPTVEATRQEDRPDTQVDDQNLATQPSVSVSAADTSTEAGPVKPNSVSRTVLDVEVGGTAGPSQGVKAEAESKSVADKEEAPVEPPASTSAEDDYEEPVFASIRPR